MCKYTNHKHYKTLNEHTKKILNNPSLKLLTKKTINHTQTNINIITPNNIINNQIKTIRETLNKNNHLTIPIINYTTKYTNTFYKPFQNTTNSTPQHNNQKNYQINPTNGHKTLIKITLNLNKKTNIIIIKPTHTYLNII